MKIAFVTGCLAPGKDGVGDYTRLLAEECVRRGHECRLLALHDGYIYGSRSSEQSAGATLQFGRNTPWPARVNVGRAFLQDFQPDWVSLQFVHYGFDRRGLGMRLPRFLSQLLAGFPVHLMLHELWIGAERGAKFRHRWTGRVQRFLLRQLVDCLTPKIVHTSNDTYVGLLSRAGIPASRLPMFGAVPLPPAELDPWCLEAMRAQGVPLTPENRSQFWILGMFGTLHPIWPPEPVLTRVQQIAGLKGKRLIVASAGRLGPGDAFWEKCTRIYAGRIHFCRLGEQSPARLVDFLRTIDFGLATSPAALMGKSATIAAMLDHGVPVIVNRDDVHYDAIKVDSLVSEPLLVKMDSRFSEGLRAVQRQAPRARLPEVVAAFLGQLSAVPLPRSVPAEQSRRMPRLGESSPTFPRTAAGVAELSMNWWRRGWPTLLRRKPVPK